MVLSSWFLGCGTLPQDLAQAIQSFSGLFKAAALDAEALGMKVPSKITNSRIWVRIKISFDDLIKVFI